VAAPGRVIAEGSPVALKQEYGAGYRIDVTLAEHPPQDLNNILPKVRIVAPQAYISSSPLSTATLHLKTTDLSSVARVVKVLEEQMHAFGITSFDVVTASVEDVFLHLVGDGETTKSDSDPLEPSSHSHPAHVSDMQLSSGRYLPVWKQAMTIFYKRALVIRKSWIPPLLAVAVAVVAGVADLSTLPAADDLPKCDSLSTNLDVKIDSFTSSLPPSAVSPLNFADILATPPGIAGSLGNGSIPGAEVTDLSDNNTFVNYVENNRSTSSEGGNFILFNIQDGGISVDTTTGASLIAWNAFDPLAAYGQFNLVANIFYNRAINASSTPLSNFTLIQTNFAAFPSPTAGSLFGLFWVVIFALGMVWLFHQQFQISDSQYLRLSIQPSSLCMSRKKDNRLFKRCNTRTGCLRHSGCGWDIWLLILCLPF
jgi:ATP-binding cassette, subfamily A (ABC1), member 3